MSKTNRVPRLKTDHQYTPFGRYLLELRLNLGRSRSDVARDLGIAHKALADYELGNSLPRLAVFRNLVYYYKADPAHMLNLLSRKLPDKFTPGPICVPTLQNIKTQWLRRVDRLPNTLDDLMASI